MMRGTHQGAERGATLILALVFLIVVGLLAAAVLGMAFTGVRSTEAFRQERALRYNAESAINTAILMVARQPTLAVVDPSDPSDPTPDPNPAHADCGLRHNMRQDTADGTQPTFYPDSTLQVICRPTPANTRPPASDGRPGADGGQNTRDVTFYVYCYENTLANLDRIPCASFGGSTVRTLAEVRVRFEPDYNAADPTRRAVIPKIISWDTLD